MAAPSISPDPKEVLSGNSRLIDTVIHPVTSHMAFESCVEQLGSAIQLDIFEPGTMLPPERVLAEMMEVSRTTVREAISAMREAGFVTTKRGRGGGTMVEPIHGASMRELSKSRAVMNLTGTLAFRAIIEPGACHCAAKLELGEDARSLLNDCLNDTLSASTPVAYRQADARLHLAIASVCGSAELSKVYSTMQTTIYQLLDKIPFLPRNIGNSDEQHRTIIQSILEGDADGARFAMEEHCESTAALLRGLLK